MAESPLPLPARAAATTACLSTHQSPSLPARSAVRRCAAGSQPAAAAGVCTEPAAVAARCAAGGGHIVSAQCNQQGPALALVAAVTCKGECTHACWAHMPSAELPAEDLRAASGPLLCSALEKVQPRAVSYEEQVGAAGAAPGMHGPRGAEACLPRHIQRSTVRSPVV